MTSDLVCGTKRQIESVSYCSHHGDANQPIVAVASSSLEGSVWDGALALIDAVTGEPLCLTELEYGVSEISWCGKDFGYIACASDDGSICLVEVIMDVDFSFNVISSDANFEGHDDLATSVATNYFNPCTIISGGWDHAVKIWDVTNMQRSTCSYHGHMHHVTDVDWNKKSASIFASSSRDCTIQVCDKREESPTVALATPFRAMCLDWHPKNETFLSTGLENGTVLTFDIRSPTVPISEMNHHKDCVYRVRYCPVEDDLLASSAADATVQIIAGSVSGKPSLRYSYNRHTDHIGGLTWITRDPLLVATGSWDCSLRVWHPTL